MELIIGQQSFQYPNEIDAISKLFNQLEEMLSQDRLVLQSLTIDNQVVEEDIFSYMEDRIQHIGRIVANVVTLREIRDDSLLSMEQYLTRAIPHMERLAGEFYQGGSKESWEEFVQLTEALDWITEVLESIGAPDLAPENGKQINELRMMLVPTIQSLGEAVEQADTTYIGDIMTHEIVPLLTKLLDEVRTTVANEGIRHDLN